MFGTFGDPFGWSPWEQLERLQEEMDRLFAARRPGETATPPVNVWIGENDALVTAELPGYDGSNLDLSVHGSTLTIKGRRENGHEDDVRYLLRERRNQRFMRRLELPFEIDADHVEARFQNGVLTIKLPRSEADRPRHIAIEAS